MQTSFILTINLCCLYIKHPFITRQSCTFDNLFVNSAQEGTSWDIH